MTEPAIAPTDAGQAPAAPVDGGQAPATPETPAAWYGEATPETVGYIQNKGWDEPSKAIEAYQNLEKFQGVPADQLLKLPKEGEPMDAVYDRLGRPESADAYEWDAPEGTQVDDAYLSAMKASAHAEGVSQKGFEAMANAHAEYEQKILESHHAEIAKQQEVEIAELKKEWGSGFEERAELGRRFIAKNLPDGMDKQEALNAIEKAIGSAAMLKMFANAGDSSNPKEDNIEHDTEGRRFGYTKEQAAADKTTLMAEISADRTRLDNYNNGIGPDIEKMQRLNKLIAS